MKKNPLTAIDFYKADHRRQYPDGTSLVYANFTPRSNRLSNLPDNNEQIVFFGLQYFIKDYLQDMFNDNFFNEDKEKVVSEYKRRMDTSLGKDSIPVDHIESLHDLGYLPLEIKALPEGTKVNMGVPCMTVKNTHPDFFWLVNYIESVMSNYLWKPCISATTASWYRNLLDQYAQETSSVPELVDFQAHDFSFRGMSGLQDATLSGAGHLLSFLGTDTVPSIDFLEDYYNANAETSPIGMSVPATEHSVMCMGSKEGEIETFERLITELYPSGIVSIVSDTWDYWQVLTEFLPKLKDKILARSGNPIANKVVIRPDSGDPVKIVCGDIIEDFSKYEKFINDDMDVLKEYVSEFVIDEEQGKTPHGEIGSQSITEVIKYKDKFYSITVNPSWNRYDKQYYYIIDYTVVDFDEVDITPEQKGSIEVLWDIFGGTVNDKGYKELDPHIGLIYGDSITPDRAKQILHLLKEKGFASTNIVFGVGSYTYQYVTRDTYGFAVKATYGVVDGKGREIFKDPVTDNGTKKSAKGLLVVEDGKLLDRQSTDDSGDLTTTYKNGKLIIEHSLDEIRERLK